MMNTRMTKAERQLIALEKGLRNVRKILTTMIREISPKSRHAVKDLKLTECRGLGSPQKDCEDANVQMTLGLFTFDADHAYPPSMTLNRIPAGVWSQIRRIMHNNGGKWCSKGYFKFDRDAMCVFDALKTGKIANRKKDRQAFYTPAIIAHKVVTLADVRGKTVLEPSAGEGALAQLCAAHYASHVTCYEIDRHAYETLRAKGFSASHCDFLDMIGRNTYERIVMNPPFAKDAYVAHIAHAMKFLAHGGKLVAVIPGDRVSSKLADALPVNSTWDCYPLPKSAFKESGTNIQTSVVVIEPPRK